MTLPAGFWSIYYCLIAATFIYGFIVLFKGLINRFLSLVTIILSVVFPILFIAYSIGRPVKYNELEHFFYGLINGELVAWFLLGMMAYLCVWWVLLLKKLIKR